ncbi:MAG TPA: LON peptidase substrate-binding domain-containing protein [Jatrophihabitans sp.]
MTPGQQPRRVENLPMFPLGTVLVPEMALALHVFEPRYRQLVADLLSVDEPGAPVFGVVALRHGLEVGELGDVYEVGTTARVTDVLPMADGRCDLAAVGERRFVVHELDTAAHPYLMASVSYLPEPDGDIRPGSVAAVRRAWQAHLAALDVLGVEPELDLEPPVDARQLSYAVARLASLPLSDRQVLLSKESTAQRLASAHAILRRETELLRQLRAVPATASAFRTSDRSG